MKNKQLRSYTQVPYACGNGLHSGHQGTGELLWLARLHAYCQTLFLGELLTNCVPPLGEDSQKLVPGFSWILSYVPFIFTNFDLQCFAVIHYYCDYDNVSVFCQPSLRIHQEVKTEVWSCGSLGPHPTFHLFIVYFLMSGIIFVSLLFKKKNNI